MLLFYYWVLCSVKSTEISNIEGGFGVGLRSKMDVLDYINQFDKGKNGIEVMKRAKFYYKHVIFGSRWIAILCTLHHTFARGRSRNGSISSLVAQAKR